ncbi:MAG TPA: isoleucine--tRNA ligase [Gemmatimonadaceae bacterium]|nr:isoleucine--tRNA ligase [Gemmatimonadaceae bacterium]
MTAGATEARYRLLPPEQSANELENELLARWRDEKLFERSVKAREGGDPFVFFEGPPTANGRPGIHHVFARTVKDLFCRHRAMRGQYVERKAGWDTHGLPVEIEVEKQLKISGKQQIEALGVAEFNRLCRESVWKYRGDWEKLSERIGYWLDYEHPYVTYHPEYVESVWWALATLHERDLLYRGHKILPYCPRCETALSSHEVAQGWADVDDPSVFVALDVVEAKGRPVATTPEGRSTRRILVWTTTPWTLVSNVALAVRAELKYAELRRKSGDQRTVILAEARVPAVLGEDWADRWEVVATLEGSELAGWRYARPLDWAQLPEAGARQLVVLEEFVSASDGTGVVHMAPAFGADDYAAGQRNGLAFVQPVNGQGQFPQDMPIVGGRFVKAADPLIVEELKRRDVLWRAGTINHPYPHCWRCKTPLLYYARTSWFIRTTAFRDAMLARNARVDWHPEEVGKGRFGEWLTNNIDWAISRDRYWGTPLPLWLCDTDERHTVAVGSFARLAELSGSALPEDFDPHKPHIDGYSWRCGEPRCKGTMRRAPEVIDTWFDSGSMPFAQWHYPFENREQFERSYPADFIAEGVDQTRGWFYSLLAIATGLGDALPNNGLAPGTRATVTSAAPYRAVVVNGHLNDAAGKKMSKSLGNIVEPWQVVERYGADAVRLFLIANGQVGMPRSFDEAQIRTTTGNFLLTLRNIYSGIFAQYANFGWSPSELDPAPAQRPLLDRWVLSRLETVTRAVDQHLLRYEPTEAARLVVGFVDEDVSKWYVRQSRSRFYDVDGADNRAAFATLHTVLVGACRLLAPFAPFVSDWLHRELTGESVHLASFGLAGGSLAEPGLEEAMDAIRILATLGRAAREEAAAKGANPLVRKVRQPIGRVVCVVNPALVERVRELLPLVEAELNARRAELATSADALVTLEAKPNYRTLGKKFGKSTPEAADRVRALSSAALLAFEKGEPLELTVDGVTRRIDAEDVEVKRRAVGELVVAERGGYFAAIDPAITPELRREGLVRELIAAVQRFRKERGLAVSDRIELAVSGDDELLAAVKEHRDHVAGEVLAIEVAIGDGTRRDHPAVLELDLDGVRGRIALTRKS